MCAAKAADVDAYAAGWLAPSAAAKGARLALITLFLFSAHTHTHIHAATPQRRALTGNYWQFAFL
jgi:hypothetical protein